MRGHRREIESRKIAVIFKHVLVIRRQEKGLFGRIANELNVWFIQLKTLPVLFISFFYVSPKYGEFPWTVVVLKLFDFIIFSNGWVLYIIAKEL